MSDEPEAGGTVSEPNVAEPASKAVTQQNTTMIVQDRVKWYERFQWPQLILTMIVSGMVGFALYVVLIRVVPESNHRIADIMLGYLMGIFSAVCSYWVGTTKASDDKTGLLAKSPPVDPH